MNTYLRQNEAKALKYLKASAYCLRKETRITYTVISISVMICLFGIFIRYMHIFFNPEIFEDSIKPVQTLLSQILNIFSGIFLICQIFISKYLRRIHKVGINLQERYDNYIYNLPENKIIMVAIHDSDIDNYARKIKRKQEQFLDYYFKTPQAAKEKSHIFDNQYKQFLHNYKLMNYVKAFFYCIWIGFIVAIIALAASFDDKFISTLINTLIPSLSIISIIMASSHNFSESMALIQNGMNVMRQTRENSENPKLAENISLSSPSMLRNIQDGLFLYRMNSFMIPGFLQRSFNKKEKKFSWESVEEESSKKTVKETQANAAKEKAKVKEEETSEKAKEKNKPAKTPAKAVKKNEKQKSSSANSAKKNNKDKK